MPQQQRGIRFSQATGRAGQTGEGAHPPFSIASKIASYKASEGTDVSNMDQDHAMKGFLVFFRSVEQGIFENGFVMRLLPWKGGPFLGHLF